MAAAPKATFHTILAPRRLQVDTAIAILLLREYGDKAFPGISKAKLEFARELPDDRKTGDLEEEGIIALDLGGGRFDHHRKTRAEEQDCVAVIVARYLKVDEDPALFKLLAFAHRDDIEGKGIISKDRIDRAFGFSGLFLNVVRDFPKEPEKVFATVEPLLLAHLREERTRAHVLPKEYMTQYDAGNVDAFVVFHQGREVRCMSIISDRTGMVGFLRAHPNIKADVVIQRFTSGHTNIVTNQERKVDLTDVAALVRLEEARKKRIPFDSLPLAKLTAKAILPEIPEWYYDTAANTIQNGGLDPEGISATQCDLRALKRAVIFGLDPQSAHKRGEGCTKKCPYNGYRRHREFFEGGSGRPGARDGFRPGSGPGGFSGGGSGGYRSGGPGRGDGRPPFRPGDRDRRGGPGSGPRGPQGPGAARPGAGRPPIVPKRPAEARAAEVASLPPSVSVVEAPELLAPPAPVELLETPMPAPVLPPAPETPEDAPTV